MIIDTPPQTTASLIWQYNSPEYAFNYSTASISVSTANTSAGFGLKITAKTNAILLQFACTQSSSVSENILIYRSTKGIPAQNTAPPSTDVLIGSFPSPVSGNNGVIKVIDTSVVQGTTYYYYIVISGTQALGVTSIEIPSLLGSVPLQSNTAGVVILEALNI